MRETTRHSVSRRDLFRGALAATGLALGGCRGGAGKPNILWIIAEDFCPDLSCYGNPDLETPNIDRLASQGMRFTRAFVTGPVCSASRSALATGMYQTTIGAHNHRSHRRDGYRLPEPVRVFTHILQDAGYHTSNLKNSHGLQGTGKTDLNFQAEHVFDGEDWSERKPGQPFYAQINFSETHRAFKRFPKDPTDPDKLTTLPPYYPDHPAVRLDWACYLDDAKHLDVKVGRVLGRLEEEGLAEDTIVFFFADHGRPMPRGKQFLYDAGIHIPLIVRVPEKFSVEGYRAGETYDELVSAIDITATTLQLAGIQPPAYMEGRPFFGPAVEPRPYIIAARDRCDETVDRIRCVRDKQFKYIKNFFPDRPYTQQNVYKDTQYATLAVMRQLKEEGKLTGPAAQFLADTRPPEELYDLENDPYEVHNLAEDAAHAERLGRMRRILEDWIQQTGDKGQILENEVQEQDKYRSEVDGWCTRRNALASKAGGRLKVETFGKGAHLIRAYVAQGPEFEIELRARAEKVSIKGFRWGTIEDLRNPEFRTAVDLAGDGRWRTWRTDFRAEGWLAQLELQFSEEPGEVEFDWIRLWRRDGGRRQLVKEWKF